MLAGKINIIIYQDVFHCKPATGEINITMKSYIVPPYSTAVFSNLFSHAAHPNLSKTHAGTPQNFASR
jgi:hypothetical protein